jgi:hypothetical protein
MNAHAQGMFALCQSDLLVSFCWLLGLVVVMKLEMPLSEKVFVVNHVLIHTRTLLIRVNFVSTGMVQWKG